MSARKIAIRIAGSAAGSAIICLASGASLLSGTTAFAQTGGAYPNKPLRIIIPFPPGGSLDVLGRLVGEKLGPMLGQPVVADNRPGASGALGAEAVAKSAPDGYTILISANTLMMLPLLRKDLPFDPLKDLVPIVNLAMTPVVLVVNPSFPARNTAEFIAAAKTMKGGVSYGTSGIASPLHMAGELLASIAAIPMVHIPYNGAGPAVIDVLGGRIPAMISPLNSVQPHIKSAKLIAIAVTDAQRSSELPDVPTLRETVPAMPPVAPWIGLLASAGTSAIIVTRINADVNRILQMTDVRDRLKAQTFEVRGGSAESFGALMREESATNTRIVNEGKIKLQ